MTVLTRDWPLGQTSAVSQANLNQPLFRGLSRTQMTRIRRSFDEVLLDPAQALAEPAANAHLMGIVDSGALREDVQEANGYRLFGLIFAQEIFAPGRSWTRLTAIEETRLLTCEADRFAGLLDTMPRLRLNYLHAIQDQISQARQWYVMLGRKTARERVASLLHNVWMRQGQPQELALHLTRAELGQLLCLTLETVSRQMKALEQQRIIRMPQPSHVLIRDPQALFAATGESSTLRDAA